MQSRSKNLNWESLSEPWAVSWLIHGAIAAFAFYAAFSPSVGKKRALDLELLEFPKAAPQSVLANPPLVRQKKPLQHQVFGASRKSVTSPSGETLKSGNTVAKTPDADRLRPGDQDSLPIPSDDYLITKMPELKNEVRVVYPASAKKRKVQGAVVMDLLIDETGKVREAKLIEGPDPELNDSAIAATQNFRFTSAMIGEKPVAVRIRYAYRFVLEH